MPRVHSQRKNRAGRDKVCGRCGHKIEPGETYYSFEFRYGGAHIRCSNHYPKPSELTQSKMSEVYAAQEGAEEDIKKAETSEDIEAAVQAVGEAARNVADEYREADEAFGGQGATESAERADELEGWADELEYWGATEDPDPENEDDPLENIREEAQAAVDECPL